MVLFQDPDEIVRIKIRRKTREELKQYGVKGETYEIIIRRLMGREGRGLEKFKMNISVLPSLIIDENNELIEVIACSSISGGKDYEENMPKGLTLIRKQKSGKSYTATYTQVKQNRLQVPPQKEIEIEKALLFVRHIETHLKDLGIEGKVVCKICEKTIDEIYDESKLEEEKGKKV